MKLFKFKILNFKLFLCLFLIALIGVNAYYFNSNSLTQIKRKYYSVSKGDSYFGLLNFWYFLAKSGNWSQTQIIEYKIDSQDIIRYKNSYEPQSIARNIDLLNQQTNKTVEDYLELAKLYALSNQDQKSFAALSEARRLDPIREDIEKLYFSSPFSSLPSASPSPLPSSPSF